VVKYGLGVCRRPKVAERFLTLHPEGKNGVNIDKQKYLLVREAILEALRAAGEMAFSALMEDVRRELEDIFDGSISWYVTTVKLDLEARGEIERVPGKKPQHLRLTRE
jgi:hypothetical protein